MKAKLDNIILMANSPRKLRDFYVNVLGLQELGYLSHPPKMYMLDCKGCTLCIQESNENSSSSGKERVELGFEVEDVDDLFKKIKNSEGRIISDEQQMGWGFAFSAADPEGHLINIYKFENAIS